MTERETHGSPGPDGRPLAGRSLGHYRVGDEIGRGGMGRVYRALDTRLDRVVALKVLASRIARDEESVRRFVREAHLLAALNHPNVAAIHSWEEIDGIRFFTMEHVPGETLEERLARAPLATDEALGFALQISRGLEAAHRRLVVHRDLKPSNIRIDPDGRVKVLDFGIGHRMPAGDTQDSTRSGSSSGERLGTVGYASPEQLRGQLDDPRTDLFSFGCVLFECLAGRPAFPGATGPDRVVATLDREPDWSALPDDVGEATRDLLVSCLAKAPADRPADATELVAILEEERGRRRRGGPVPRGGVPADSTLPRRRGRFFGRRQEIEETRDLLCREPLVTLTGPGGCGKTRLAIEAAAGLDGEFPGGIRFVELAPITDPIRVPTAVAAALGVREEPGRSIAASLGEYARDRRMLLILDNCEHVREGAADLVRRLLDEAPSLVVLATSREALRLAEERVVPMASLGAPPKSADRLPAELAGFDAVRLFTDRGAAARAGFALDETTAPAIAAICRRLDGIPLALELAAARLSALPVDEIARRLDDRFALLDEGDRHAPAQHRTLRALVDWSWDQLGDDERTVLRRLAVFRGGWTVDAAERVCAGDGLAASSVLGPHSRLVEKSLVEMGETEPALGGARYRMLETVREYAAGKLQESDEGAATRARHLGWCVELAERAERRLKGNEQTAWLLRLAAEHQNFRAAFRECFRNGTDPSVALRLAGALGRYWMVRGHWTEGRALCAEALARGAGARRESREGARTLNAAGNLAFHQSNYNESKRAHREALVIRRLIGDREGEGNSLNNLGEVARMQGDYDEARTLYNEGLTVQREIGDRWGVAVSLNNLGEVAQAGGDYAAARASHEEALGYWPSIGDRWGMAWSLSNLGFVATRQQRWDDARSFYTRSLELGRDLGDRFGIALSLHELGVVAERQGDGSAAHRFLGESLAIRRELGDRRGIAESLEAYAFLGEQEGHPGRAARLLGAAAAIRGGIHAPAVASRHDEIDDLARRLRVRLGDGAFETERDAARTLSLEAILEEIPARDRTTSTADMFGVNRR